MLRWNWAHGSLVLGLMLMTAATIQADRVPSQKVEIPRAPGALPVVAVPVTTNGFGNLGVYQGIAVRIYATPVVDEPRNPQARPVYNLPFYGASQAFGSSNGVDSRPKYFMPQR